ncbi:NAD(P)-dependent oxidoreductase [Patescibacteria group bacterium]|nr:NAD(P)-dependent oxidoreductase [Patescibacteria group bacterium]
MKSDRRRRKIVILGHTGFLGSCLYENFSKEIEYEVYGFSSANVNLSSSKECQKLLSVIDKNSTVIMTATSLVKNKDFISFRNDFDMLLNTAEVFSLAGIQHLIYISSIAVFGRHSESVITESSYPNPDDLYSFSKLLGEQIFERICRNSGIHLTILRPGTFYGLNDKTSPFFRFLGGIKSNGEIKIYGDGSSKLFWVHKVDLCRIIQAAVASCNPGIYNIVTESEGISLLKLAELMFQICALGHRIKIEFIPSAKVPVDLRFDISKSKSCFSGIKHIKLEDGLKEYLNQTDKKEE